MEYIVKSDEVTYRVKNYPTVMDRLKVIIEAYICHLNDDKQVNVSVFFT